jgi:hypothetical protein
LSSRQYAGSLSKVLGQQLTKPEAQRGRQNDLRLVMEKVMGHVVTYIPKNASTVYRCGSIPIVVKYGMGEFPERHSEDQEQSGRHDEAVFIHGKIMVDPV